MKPAVCWMKIKIELILVKKEESGIDRMGDSGFFVCVFLMNIKQN